MEECVVIVDNSNIWIEGMKCSAAKKNLPTTKEGKEPCDYDWRIDFGKLLGVVAEGKKIREAILVGSKPPRNDSLWHAAKKNGFTVKVENRNSQNKEKAVDTNLTVYGVRVICKGDPAVLKVLSGDSDFKPLIECAKEEKWETEIWTFSSALGSKDIKKIADRVVTLDSHLEEIQLTKEENPIQPSGAKGTKD